MSKVGFIGVGNLASAVISGSIRSGSFSGSDYLVYDLFSDKTAENARLYGTTAAQTAQQEKDQQQGCQPLQRVPGAVGPPSFLLGAGKRVSFFHYHRAAAENEAEEPGGEENEPLFPGVCKNTPAGL